MQRRSVTPRADWQARVEAQGLTWHSADGQAYWSEGHCYTLSEDEIERIAAAGEDLHQMLLRAGDVIIEQDLFARFGIPGWCVPLIVAAWEREPPALNHGRFDFGLDRDGVPRLFEYNCDTPTALVEAAVVQWFWKEDVFPDRDQYNRIHEALLDRWRAIAPDLPGGRVHFAHAPDRVGEDTLTTAYMMDLAREAGLDPVALTMREIGWRDGFRDLAAQPIAALWKLYPWEWLVAEPFGRHIAEDPRGTLWIEPIWKMLWSNKAILPMLWHLFPDHPNLLRAEWQAPSGRDHVIKPMLGREGANIAIIRDRQVLASHDGAYTGPAVYQDFLDMPDHDGYYPVIGAWMVDGTSVGVGIREGGRITSNRDRFVPHIIA
jgi:glutathionylspermidine synthase